MPDGDRYLRNEAKFKVDAYAVTKPHLRSKRAFEQYYAKIPVQQRNEFLRVCATYRYLAKHGDWKVNVRGINPVIDYLTNSYKLVAVFSLIESLSELDYIDFYQWLASRSRKQCYPIEDRNKLEVLYREYKASYGAVRRCVNFFSRLPVAEQTALCRSVKVNKKPTAKIKRLAEHLYNLRSGFVHKAEFAHEVCGPIFVRRKREIVHSELTVPDVFRAFELGLLVHFGSEA